jgi:hypothetical protein
LIPRSPEEILGASGHQATAYFDPKKSLDVIRAELYFVYFVLISGKIILKKESFSVVTSTNSITANNFNIKFVVEFMAKKSRNYAVLRLKSADMGRKVQETNAYNEAET